MSTATAGSMSSAPAVGGNNRRAGLRQRPETRARLRQRPMGLKSVRALATPRGAYATPLAFPLLVRARQSARTPPQSAPARLASDQAVEIVDEPDRLIENFS